MLVQPVLGACRIGINAFVWLDDDTVCVAHGSFISWCDAELREQPRLTLQSHVQAIAPYADGGVAASLEGAGVLVVSPEGQVAHEYPMERARGVFTKPEACSADGEVAVLRSVQDEGKDYHYTVAELYSRTCAAGQRYGSPDSFGSDISSLPDVSPCLGVAIGAGMWGIAMRPLVGSARELKCAPFEWPCLLEAPWVLLSRGMHIEKVNLETGEVPRSAASPGPWPRAARGRLGDLAQASPSGTSRRVSCVPRWEAGSRRAERGNALGCTARSRTWSSRRTACSVRGRASRCSAGSVGRPGCR